MENWKKHESALPKLASTERTTFAIPGSSTEPEHHCSAGGLTFFSMRTSMSTENLEKLIILNESIKNNF